MNGRDLPLLIGETLRLSARRAPDTPALIADDATLTYAALDRQASACAHAILAAASHRRIALMCHNGPDYAVAYFGAARARALCIHLSTRYTPAELAFALGKTKPDVVVIDAETLAALHVAASGLAAPPVIWGSGPGLPADVPALVEVLAGQPKTDPDVAVSPEDAFAVNFTGGTTGTPKGAVASHAARVLSAIAAAEDFRLRTDDILAVATPLCHAAGLFTWFQTAVHAGACCVLLPRWDPAAFVAAVERHSITGAFFVPAQLAMLLESPACDPARLANLRLVAYGGAPASRDLLRRAEHVLPNVSFVQAYGMTETGHLFVGYPADRHRAPDSLGRPGRRIEIGVFAEPGRKAAPGEVGEIATRGVHLMQGYLDEPEQTTSFFKSRDGWGWTGDLGFLDTDGLITLVARNKEVIISGGMNVYPSELEAPLLGHPDIDDCGVVGLPDPIWGEVPAAAIVLRPGATLTETAVLDLSARSVARHKRVRSVRFVAALPRTGSGKLQRNVLRDMLLEEAAH